ncbi:MAG: anti-sigma factor antagonist [Acidobacteriaceae bacterium]|jgi:anti-sigma B factor antagonist|nr:anti-sigma factor antagonist [Acidobacteriaceae bacterium]
MKLVTRLIDCVEVVQINGRIELGEGSSAVREMVRDLLAKGRKKILFNLADVEYIDSAGLGVLVSAFTSVRNEGGELKLIYLTKKVQDLLQMTRLYTVFEIYNDEEAALTSFDKSAASSASTACD